MGFNDNNHRETEGGVGAVNSEQWEETLRDSEVEVSEEFEELEVSEDSEDSEDFQVSSAVAEDGEGDQLDQSDEPEQEIQSEQEVQEVREAQEEQDPDQELEEWTGDSVQGQWLDHGDAGFGEGDDCDDLTLDDCVDQAFWGGGEEGAQAGAGDQGSHEEGWEQGSGGNRWVRPLVMVVIVGLVALGVAWGSGFSFRGDSREALSGEKGEGGSSTVAGQVTGTAGEGEESGQSAATTGDQAGEEEGAVTGAPVAEGLEEGGDPDCEDFESAGKLASAPAQTGGSGRRGVPRAQGSLASTGGVKGRANLSYTVIDDPMGAAKKRSALPSHRASFDHLPATLTTNQIMNVIRTKRRSLQSCFERQLRREGMLGEQKTVIKFEIGRQGTTGKITIEGGGDNTIFSQCVEQQVRRWKFPPFSGDPIPVEYPVVLTATH